MIRAGGDGVLRIKKVRREGAKGGGLLVPPKVQEAKVEKRKENMVDGWHDGFDVVMGEVEVSGKKLKTSNVCDGNEFSLIITEVGVN